MAEKKSTAENATRYDVHNPLKCERVIYGEHGRVIGPRLISIKPHMTARDVALSEADVEMHRSRPNDLKLFPAGQGPADPPPPAPREAKADPAAF